jgi:hypothetical protein
VFELKSFMRVIDRGNRVWIVSGLKDEWGKDILVAADGSGWNTPFWDEKELDKIGASHEFLIKEVYARPKLFQDLFQEVRKGILLWKCETPRQRQIRELKEQLAKLEQEENAGN